MAAGTYQLTVTDANGCTDVDSITLTEPTGVTTAVATSSFPSGTTISCFGAADGTIDLTPSGGIPGYTYSWTGPGGFSDTVGNLSNLSAGNYQYTVTDTNGCAINGNVFMTQPGQMIVNAAGWLYNGGKNISCFGESDGKVSLLVFGGTPGYSQLWSGPNGFSSTATFIDSLSVGTYFVTVFDNQGCTATDSIELTQPDSLKINLNFTDINCPGGSDGSVTAFVTGGAMPYSYTWNPLTDTVANVSNLTPGVYALTVTDANGCMDQASATLQVQGSIPVVNLGNDTTTSNGDPLLLNAGSGFSSYSWQDGSTGSTFLATVDGTYWVEVTNANGCTGSDTIQVSIGPVGIEDLVESVQVKLYPNPTRHDLTLEWDRVVPTSGTLQILSSLGTQVHMEPFAFGTERSKTIPMAQLAAGLYFVRIVSGDQQYVFRIEKQ